jgi:predicted amidohydrolase
MTDAFPHGNRRLTMFDLTRRDSLKLAGLAPVVASAGSARAAPRKAKPMTEILQYVACALQITAPAVNRAPDRATARAQMMETILRIGGQVRSTRIFLQQYTGAPLKLVVLPEYFMTSYPGPETLAAWADKAAIRIPDSPEIEALGKIAQAEGIYLAGNAYEDDPNFPGLYFQACFIIDPSGEVVLRYRRLNSMFAPTPHDVWAKYLDLYGYDAVFPVARTAIGKLAAIASEEILYPEIARMMGLKGAEVFVHPTSEIGSPLRTQKAIARQARAFENLAYVVSANTAGISGTAMPLASADGNSQVLDYKGAVLAESNAGETFTAFAELDIADVRRIRRKPGMTNYLARQRLDLFAPGYAGTTVHAANGMMEGGAVTIPAREYFVRKQQEIIDRMIKAGIL